MPRKQLYYTKSQITTALYTSGKEWMTTDGQEYIGYYHKYYDGVVLTEANYIMSKSVDLIPYISIIAQPSNREYNKIIDKKDYVAPKLHFPSLELEDYNKGFVKRYFLQRRNSISPSEIIEINLDQYSSIDTPKTGIDGSLYFGIEVDWKLTGPLHDIKEAHNIIYGVADTNYRVVHLKDNDMKGLKNFLTDYIELSIYSPLTSNSIKKLFGN